MRILPALVDLDPAGSGEADPDDPGAGGQELGDLERRLLLILSRVGVFHRQGGSAMHPAQRVGDVADRHVRGAQRLRRGGVAGVDPHLFDRRIAVEHRAAEKTGA
jgi:hypothetical protein